MMLRDVRVTKNRARVPAVVVVHGAKMKEAWCLATTLSDKKASEIVKLYGKRFSIEETFRDEKDFILGWACPRLTSAIPIGATACFCSRRSPMHSYVARCRERGSRSRPVPESQHRQAPYAFTLSAGVLLVRLHPDDARRLARAVDDGIRSDRPRARRLPRDTRRYLRGCLRALSTLAHHIDIDWLKEAYRRTRKDGATGVDGQTAGTYADELGGEPPVAARIARSPARTGRRLCGVCISRRAMGRRGPSGFRPSRTRCFNGRSRWCWRPSTSRTSWTARTGSGPGGRPTTRYGSLWDETMEMHGGWVLEIDIRKFLRHSWTRAPPGDP